jgi:rhodanese-related sulfurtransferase
MTAKTLAEAKEVCPTTTRRLLTEGALMVDVREANEVAALAFEVDSVVNIPLSQFEQRWAELPRDRELVLVCETGARSLKATYFLQYQGYEQVANMGGGLVKWMTKGFPVKGQRHVPAAAASAGSCCGGAAVAATSCCDPTSVAESPSAPCCSPTESGTVCCTPAATAGAAQSCC